jgi:peptidoglycan/LPS O-acetylase OafA/YrhL
MKTVEILTKELFEYIGKYRSALMGFSMIWVFLFHAQSQKLGFMPTGLWGTFCKNGNLGVDVFFFLSAFGLCYSLKKNTIKRFYFNRFKRIIPTWWVVLFLIHIIGIFVGSKFDSFDYPRSAIDMFYWYTGLGYFFKACSYEWFIPTLLLFYLLTPAFYKLSRNLVLFIILLSIPLILLYKGSGVLPYISLSITRIPAFLLGVLFFKDLEQNKHNLFLFTCISLFICVFALSFFWNVPDVIQAMPLLPIVMGLVSLALSLKYTRYIEAFLAFVGTISLEFYLIHGHRRPQFLLSHFIKDSEMLVLGAFILCLVLSYILHLVMKKVNEKLLFHNSK